MNQPPTPVDRSVTRCLVCGSSEIRSDEVIDRGWVLLAECPRCAHRWTEPWPAATPVRLRPAWAPVEEREAA